jgi:membrane protein YqaA with SNARE-associated domain
MTKVTLDDILSRLAKWYVHVENVYNIIRPRDKVEWILFFVWMPMAVSAVFAIVSGIIKLAHWIIG